MPHRAEATPQQAKTDPANPGGFVHIPALDGIRGTAILLVLIVHLFESNNVTGSRLLDIIQRIFASAYIGVNLFFALSGFLITGILLDTLHIPHFFKTFYARRSLRIFPLYYGFLLLALCLTRPLHLIWNGWQYYFLTYSANLVLWTRNVPFNFRFFNPRHFWSLQVEEQFYLIWPLVIYRVRKLRTLVRICLITCGAILALRIVLVVLLFRHVLVNKYLPCYPTFSCADNLLYGCCLGILLRTHWRETIIRRAPLVLAVCTALLILMAIPTAGLYQFPDRLSHVFVPTIGFSLLPIGFSAMIAMALQPASKTQHVFQSPLLRFFGKYSYGLYVLHYPLHLWLQLPLRLFFVEHLHSKAVSTLLEAVTVGAISVLAAMLSYHLYEVQFLKLKRFFNYSRAATKDPIANPA